MQGTSGRTRGKQQTAKRRICAWQSTTQKELKWIQNGVIDEARPEHQKDNVVKLPLEQGPELQISHTHIEIA